MATVKRTYKVKFPDGSAELRECRNWNVEWRDADGRVRRRDGSADKRVATVRLGEVERRLIRGEHDLVNPFEPHARRPVLEHVADYVRDLEASGRDDKYAYNVDGRLRKLVAGAGWRTLRDVDANSFVAWRERERQPAAAGARRRAGRMGAAPAATTLNQYLEAARSWLNWCAANGRVAGVPIGSRTVSTLLGGVAKVTGPKVRKRRALSDEQVGAVLAAAAADRRLVYRFALSTGLRRQELADLAWGDVGLRAIRPYVQLRAEATKARRGDRIDLPASLAADLRAHRPADARDSDRVFPVVPPIEDWRADLAAAGVPYVDDMGRRADFHGGTRKTLCTRMARGGVPLAVAMRRMRHTDAKLTMVDYLDDDQLGQEAGVLPEVEPTPPAADQGGGATVGGA